MPAKKLSPPLPARRRLRFGLGNGGTDIDRNGDARFVNKEVFTMSLDAEEEPVWSSEGPSEDGIIKITSERKERNGDTANKARMHHNMMTREVEDPGYGMRSANRNYNILAYKSPEKGFSELAAANYGGMSCTMPRLVPASTRGVTVSKREEESGSNEFSSPFIGRHVGHYHFSPLNSSMEDELYDAPLRRWGADAVAPDPSQLPLPPASWINNK